MSITLVGDLKEAINVKKAPRFNDIAADELKLWKVEIHDDCDDLLSTLTLENNAELTTPAGEHIHVLVEPPASTATSNREQELLDRIAVLEESLSKSVRRQLKGQKLINLQINLLSNNAFTSYFTTYYNLGLSFAEFDQPVFICLAICKLAKIELQERVGIRFFSLSALLVTAYGISQLKLEDV
ncbi:hypothetical protein RirG_030830 [Rhizophagus irregularis DAOM 197198w]|uniref:Crinkler effector protein N-terminal domain-containing protein n=1 Tax=Rhizophagus irregularis (strain DAOM 197198w) TaxID=1432141 RepID=A0A015LVI7_RHIIW|nr:hypothetical protein RirG_030830 [Rhizophagus irregularis DAOM 197198w]